MKNKNGNIVFADYPEFRPNLTPRQMFKLGSFGGTYWRTISSKVTGRSHKNIHKKYKDWWKGIPDDQLTRDWEDYDKSINKYEVKVGTTLEFWEKKGWIKKSHPYGWVHWYCDFYNGKRGADDRRQIDRWLGIAGPNGRFRKWLVTEITKKKGRWNDVTSSPKIRQTLQHWAYVLTKADYDAEKKERRKKQKKQKGGGTEINNNLVLYNRNKDAYLRLDASINNEYDCD
jgi:hypothetical protein